MIHVFLAHSLLILFHLAILGRFPHHPSTLRYREDETGRRALAVEP